MRKSVTKTRTARQIVESSNSLAIQFYRMNGYEVSHDYKMYEAHHPQEIGMWNMAVAAYEHITGECVEDALEAVFEDEDCE